MYDLAPKASIVRLMQSFGQKTKDSLATDDKYWRPPCNVTNRDALSAISRAKTERCRKEISSVSCMTENNALYPDFIKKYVILRDLYMNWN